MLLEVELWEELEEEVVAPEVVVEELPLVVVVEVVEPEVEVDALAVAKYWNWTL